MKILVISDLPPYVTGGAEMQAYRLINAWIDAGHEVRCIGRNLPDKQGSPTLYRIPMIRKCGKLLRAVSYFFSLSRIVLREQKWGDVIYTRFLGDAAATLCLLKYLGLLKAILISTPANAGASGDVYYISSAPFGSFWLRLINEHCNAINLIAPKMLEDLKNAQITKPLISQIPNGVPINPLQESNPDLTTCPLLLSVGRLTQQKGYDIFLAALHQLKALNSYFKVEIIGDGPEKKNLLGLLENYSLQDHVKFLGELNQDAIKKRLFAADIFVLPSRYEGMANAALEAMEAGKPVLLTNCGGIDTYIKSTMGWVAKKESVESLNSALAEAITRNKNELKRMGENNRSFIVENFEMKKISARYLELFDNLIKNAS